ELTKMAESQVEKGVNEISAGEKNLDDEFRGKSSDKLAKKPVKATKSGHSSKKKSGPKNKKKSKK
ncbi:hypothetical protein IIW29_01235, partial [Candidatus Saccharibacteria bacterium]|nr:hypothetical protein [Candidatus Saccharibacteria bacterium]